MLIRNNKINKRMMKDVKKLLGQRIKELRKSLNISQQELAEMIDIDQRNLSNIETGRSFPSKSLLDLADALGVSLSELFEFEHIKLTRQNMINFIDNNIRKMTNENVLAIYKFIKSLK